MILGKRTVGGGGLCVYGAGGGSLRWDGVGRSNDGEGICVGCWHPAAGRCR